MATTSVGAPGRTGTRGWPDASRHFVLPALLVAAVVGCSTGTSRQRIDITLSGGVSARMTAPWVENFCTLQGEPTALYCELRTVEGETAPNRVILNLLHYAGPGTYPGKGERAAPNVIAGVILEDDAGDNPPEGGTVVITSGNTNARRGAPVSGRIDADVRDNANGSTVHISGTFTAPLVVSG